MRIVDDRELKQRHMNGHGFIYNDFGQATGWNEEENNKLHRASCSQVKRMTYVTEGKLTKHFFQSRKEAIDWLETNRKEQGYTFCTYCNP